MYKVSIILLGFIFTACSATKTIEKEPVIYSQLDGDKLIGQTLERNVSKSGFFIEKGRINTTGEAGRISLLFTLKYSTDGRYLISLRNGAGIEAFRVLVTKDSVLINDRINKTVLYGNPRDFERITGIPTELLLVIYGDFLGISQKAQVNKSGDNGILRIDDYYRGLIIKSAIEKRIEKVKSVNITTGQTEEYISLEYSKFRNDKYGVPGKIEINDFSRKVKIQVKIEKYTAPWLGEFDFIPGKEYTLKRIL